MDFKTKFLQYLGSKPKLKPQLEKHLEPKPVVSNKVPGTYVTYLNFVILRFL